MCGQKREVIFRDSAVSALLCASVGVDNHRGIYYLIFFFITYRLFRFSSYPFWWYVALGLCVFMMVVNGLSNYVIFRARNLYLSFVIGAVFPVMDVTLFALLMALDRSAALAMIPYLLYRVYAVFWGYALWRLNRVENQIRR